MAQTKSQNSNSTKTKSSSPVLNKKSSQKDQHGLLEELFVDELKDIYWAKPRL